MNFDTSDWKAIDKLVDEQKYEEARKLLTALYEKAQRDGNASNWTRALIRDVQLGSALGGIETAVRTLRERPWPNEPLSELILELYYAQTLLNYLDGYEWEINQRERIESKNAVDLKAWTRDQIISEALRAYGRVWQKRTAFAEPSTVLGPYITRNTYPAGLRETVRDVVTYRTVELLANTRHWKPAEQNELFRVDFAAQLAGKPKPSSVDELAVHPLERALAALADLRDWHQGRNERAAALEASLEMMRRIYGGWSETADRKKTLAALHTLLGEYEDVSWWAMGKALEASWLRGSDPVAARTLALAAEKRFPGTPGATECRAIIASIEQPSFNLASPLVDGIGKRSLQVTHTNLKKLYLRAYAQDLIDRVERAKDYNLLPNQQEVLLLLGHQKPAAEWTVELPDPGDYREHTTYVTPPIQKLGYYTVLASAEPDFPRERNRVLGVHTVLSTIVIRQRTENDGSVELTALDGANGRTLPGVDMYFYEYNWQTGHKRVDQKTTDKNGQATITPPGLLSLNRGGKNYFVIAKKGDEVSPSTNGLWIARPNKPDESRGAFIFTDRSIYRPQQTINWKVLAYRGKETSWQQIGKESLVVTLYDSNHQEVAKQTVKTNDYGTAFGTFQIPTGRLLGQWHLQTSLGGHGGVRVEEYKRPTFEVKMLPAKEALALNQPVVVKGEAKYYFGLPVTGGHVKWKVTREEVYPWWWWWWRPPGGAQTIATGAADVDDKGQFAVRFTPEVKPPAADDKRGRGIQYRYHVSADLTDEGGETRSASRGFQLGWVTVDARLDLGADFVSEGETASVSLRRTNLDGDPRAGKGTWKLVELKQPATTPRPADIERDIDPEHATTQTPGDRLQPRQSPSWSVERLIASWPDGTERAKGDIATAEDGTATITLPKLAPGAYRVRYETADDRGEKLEVFRDFLVGGKHTKLAVPAVMKVKKTSLAVGDKAEVLVTSGLVDQPLYFEVYQGGHLVERRVLGRDSDSIQEVAIGKGERGGLAFQLVGVTDYQALTASASVYVPWDDRQLKVELSTFRDLLRPGQKETWRVTVRGAGQAAKTPAAAAELLAYMYDRSLDVFAPHSPPSPSSLFPNRAYAGGMALNLQPAPTLWVLHDRWAELPSGVSFTGDQLVFPDAYPMGGPGGRHVYYMRGGGGPGGPPPMPPPAPMAQAAPAPARMARAEPAPDGVAELANNAPAQPTTTVTTAPTSGGQAPAPAPEVRSNFSETAFFSPALLTDKDGSASIEFTVPDSVTSWNVWVHAIDKSFRSGSLSKETKTVKDLMVRPYLPRFLRENDDVEIKVVVQNASKDKLSGNLTFEINDPATQKSVAAELGLKDGKRPFTVEPGSSTNLTFALKAPRRVGEVAIRVVGQAGTLSDGELRPLPLLPSRLHLAQSKFATLRENGVRTLELKDLAAAAKDPTLESEQLVVTVDAQLFMTVLKALPFLVDYPYECSEQTLNRFLSAGIVASVFQRYPSVKKMAEDLVKQRTTLLDKFDAPDPNRKTLLEESPWLVDAKGGPDLKEKLIKVLDPEVAKRERDRALSRLQKMQTSIGGFPWFPGGPPSPYMTLYLLIGMSRASEFQVAVPKDMVVKAWQYVASHYRAEILSELRKDRASPEMIALLHFATTSFPDTSWLGGAFTDAERKEMLDYVFARWKKLPPLVKCIHTLSLLREKRKADATLVFASVMDSAKTTEDEGTFWQPEDRSWLWYNDRIETHAFALRTLLEINEQDPKLEGLVVWLLLNKKLNQWKSTRATAEVIYSLVKYLDQKKELGGGREEVALSIGPQKETLVFEPEKYEGKKQIRVEGKDVVPAMSKVEAKKTGKGIAFASVTWHYATDKLPDEGRGDLFTVNRAYFRREAMGAEKKLVPIAEGAKLQPGDEIEVQLTLTAKAQAEYIHVRDPRAAGLEPPITVSQYKYDLGLAYYEEVRDSATNFFIEWLPAGQYVLKYRLRAAQAGRFRVGPATLQSMYAPEFTAFSAGHMLSVDGK